MSSSKEIQVESFSFRSVHMGCVIPFGLWRPSGAPRELALLLHGKSRHSESIDVSSLPKIWNPRLKIAVLAETFQIAIVAPLCGNGWYLDTPTAKAEMMLADELLPFSERLLDFRGSPENRMLMGFSMGGYGALALLCHRPDLFGGALVKAPSDPIFRSPGGEIRDVAHELLGPPSSTPFETYMEHYTLRMLDLMKGRKVSLTMRCGADDTLLPHCRAVKEKALGLGLGLHYEEVPGEHKLSHEDLRAMLLRRSNR